MRVTNPALRRRNHAWLQMRSLDRRAARLARRQEQLDDTTDGDGFTSDDDGFTSGDDGFDSSDDELSPIPANARTFRASATAKLGARKTPTSRSTVAAKSSPHMKLRTRQVTPGEGVLPPAEEGSGDEGPEDGEEEESEEEGDSGIDGADSDLTTDSEYSSDEETTSAPNETQTSPTGTQETIDSSQTATLPAVTSTLTPLPGNGQAAVETTGTAPGASVTATIPASGEAAAVVPDSQAEGLNNNNLIGVEPQRNGLGSAAVAGIVLGILAFFGLLAGAALLWRRYRHQRGLPFFSHPRLRLADDDGGSSGRPPTVVGPFPQAVNPNLVKTNTQIMDDLMKAAYAAESGRNPVPPLPSQQPGQEDGMFLDEKAYIALAGHLTPTVPQKPVMRWLEEVKTPTQPNGPQMPPTPGMREPVGLAKAMPSAGKVMPRPPPSVRNTVTTQTTETTVQWMS